MIRLKKVSKFYYSKGIIASGFTNIDLEFDIGEFVAITGESGSGKSTLLNVIGGLDSYEEGEMYIDGKETSHYTEEDFEIYRRKYISNIFQNFNLVNSYTVYQNVELVLLLNGKRKKDIKQDILKLLKKVGLYKFRNTKVSKLSGGQKQRVAIARALAKDTPIILADEPTGSLDSKSANEVIALLSEIAKDKLVIIVTHNYEQVEKYVTRKIKMHDGRILEDKKIRPHEKVDNYKLSDLKNLTLLNQLRLGIRNAFNIIPKFILVLFVYMFMISALFFEYSAFKQEEYSIEKSGSNYLFTYADDKRIVIKKNDKTAFSEDDYKKIKDTNNVNKIVYNDLLLDSIINITDSNDYWLDGIVSETENFINNVDVGRMPTNANEIIIEGKKEDFYIENLENNLEKTVFYIHDDMTGNVDKEHPLKIVGIKYRDKNIENYNYNYKFYVSNELLSLFTIKINERYSKVRYNFQNMYYNATLWNGQYKIIPLDVIPKNSVYIDSDFNYLCKNNNCINQPLSIEVSNLYYSVSKELTVKNTYSKKNFKSLFGFDYNENNKEAIYVNSEDYQNLFKVGPYQSSVFVDDVSNVDIVSKKLNDLGYNTLVIKDTLVYSQSSKIIQIVKTIVTIIVIITLFFISYFVIQLILKSRNTYFSILRMLGASKKISKRLLVFELFVVSQLAFLLLIIILKFQTMGIYNVNSLQVIVDYLKFSDYVWLFIIINIMSYFISLKFAKKVFKKSVMKTIKEEV